MQPENQTRSTYAAIALVMTATGASGALADQFQPVTETTAEPKPTDRIISADSEPLRGALAPLIAKAQAQFAIPGLSLVLIRGDRTLWAEGFGLADPDTARPATPTTIYRAGSLAKPITALTVLQLEDSGKIDIDQPLSAYISGFKIRSRFDAAGNPITPRRALSHHAGLPTDFNKGMWSTTPFNALVPQLRDEYTAFPPGLLFSYSNLGYTLLGQLVQETAQEPFADYARRQVFDPLGMENTAFASAPTAGTELATGHRKAAAFAPLPIRDLPAHGLQTTVSDLGRFMEAILCGGSLKGTQVIAPGLIEAMLEPQNTDVPLDLDVVYGLGWFLEHGTIPGATHIARHSGASLGFSAELVMLPEQGLGVVVMANAGGVGHVLKQLAETILSQSLKAMPTPLPPDLFVAAMSPKPAAGTASAPEGSYATDFGLISIRPADAKVCACIAAETMDLIPHPDGWFGVTAGDVGSLPASVEPLTRMRFQTRHIGGRDVVIADTGKGEVVIGEKVPTSPIPPEWLDRLGTYEVINPDPGFPIRDLQLNLNDGKLCLSYAMPVLSDGRIQMPVQTVSEDAGIILGLGRTRGETVRIVDGDGEPLLRWSGYLARKMTR